MRWDVCSSRPACSSCSSSPTSSGGRAYARRRRRTGWRTSSPSSSRPPQRPPTTGPTSEPAPSTTTSVADEPAQDTARSTGVGRPGRSHRDPRPRRRQDRRRGRLAHRPEGGTGPLPRDSVARAGRQCGHRRPPHDLRRALPPHRRARVRRRDHRGDGARPLPLPGARAADRPTDAGRGARRYGTEHTDPHLLPPEVLGAGADRDRRRPGAGRDREPAATSTACGASRPRLLRSRISTARTPLFGRPCCSDCSVPPSGWLPGSPVDSGSSGPPT